jgi:hypothetical protein
MSPLLSAALSGSEQRYAAHHRSHGRKSTARFWHRNCLSVSMAVGTTPFVLNLLAEKGRTFFIEEQ